MLGILILLFHTLGLISSLHALMSTRTSQGTIAWLVVLNTFPYLAVPAYWVLGRTRFQGYVKGRQVHEKKTQRMATDLKSALVPFRVPVDTLRPAAVAGERLADVPLTKGNRVDLLIDGRATFDNILAGVDTAEAYILFQFFIVHDDGIGRQIKTHLVEKAKQGVQVFFLYDEIGSHDLPQPYIDELKAAGIVVSAFNTRSGRLAMGHRQGARAEMDAGGTGGWRKAGVDHPVRTGRQAGDRHADVSGCHQFRHPTHLDRQPLLRAG